MPKKGNYRPIRNLQRLAAGGLTTQALADRFGYTLGGFVQRLRNDPRARAAYDKGRVAAGKNPFGVGRARPLANRFWEKVKKTKDCWIWIGARDKDGYGTLNVDGKTQQAHRVSYELNVGPIPEGKHG